MATKAEEPHDLTGLDTHYDPNATNPLLDSEEVISL
jgi:hypothetical protein